MKKIIIVVLLSLVIGFLLGKFMLDGYTKPDKTIPTINLGNEKRTKVSFIQYGVYSSMDNMKNNTLNLKKYIYVFKDNLYFVFIGITKDNNNLEKLKGYFKDKGYSTYVKEFDIKNTTFLNELTNYDALLKQTNDPKSIETLCTQILEKYEGVNEI